MKRTKARKALDLIDRKILALLQDNAKISNVDLAEQVHLSPTPCLERVKRLESDGYIRQYAAHLNPQLLDAGMLVYLEVSLQNTTSEILNEFNAAVQQLPQILECHMVAGGFDYLMKIRVRDIHEFRDMLGDMLSRLPYVRETHTYVVMEEVKETTQIPLRP
ncbi:winged helix-turn-helix transcriptional regulator [Laribacter hongkongensis]|jgi:Lrp/AsnC family leucine-responsive transcriptional regulator|uniref:Leucine-responsive transcriptional regulator n=2 Tax=Laribacter hongkongensis TaxID=168471 RepID=C1D8Q4_LARHH|nr:winged helix-turn-helix transcriptional regulator [Laribacter hongkongensis]MBP8812408.1 Lrp/AsnC ligand binding domain-containing protein [Laribacter sp.]ACO74844.1 leucine-responsive transcriptional regulator [Laribacter hongkongensis HLHK9]ASJ24597.1 leucine-responsive transcriptional regulator [Laribacter hongkongensis]MBE5527733.1 leucine-responsive transcriptional regulator [Laribacter hongkongensis]MBP9527345.1 Lrp/AsnC ligand binding domain-containing protein [Laribacter sp.]